MVKSYAAHTSEIDDVELAVSEILAQLEPEKNCLKSTVVLVACYYEFATGGIIAELYKKLKCPIIGTTTSLLATNRGSGHLDLAVIMLTSDDVTFTAACSSSIMSELETPLSEMYQSALKGHAETPKLMLSAAPLLLHQAGDDYVDILSKISGGVPNFGMLAVDNSVSYENSYVIFNDRAEKDIFSVILASGKISPKFCFASIPPEKVFMNSAIITKSDRNLLKEVNGLSVYDYLDTLGMVSNGKIRAGINSIPMIIDYAGGVYTVAKSMLFVDEDGYGVCGSLMPEGAAMSIGACDKEDVVATAVRTVENILSSGDVNTLLVYSCLGRSLALGTDTMSESNGVNETANGKVPYMFAYGGGEICPVCDAVTTNHFHNNTIIACAF